MAGNLKYTMQKHKSKLWVIGSILTVLIIGAAVYFLLTSDRFVNDPQDLEQEATIAEYILTGNEDGSLRVISIEKNETVDELTLPDGKYVYAMGRDYETLYTYDGKEVKSYGVNRGKIAEEEVIATIEVKDVASFKVEGETVAFLSDDESHITFTYPDEGGIAARDIETDEPIVDYAVMDKELLYSTQENLHFVKPNGEGDIEIGDVSPTLLTMEGKWLIQNQFGSGLDSNTLMMVDKDESLIEEVAKTDSGESMLLNFDKGQKKIYTIYFVNATEPYHMLTTWYLENNKLTKEMDVTVRIPVKEDGVLYNHQTSVTGNEYLYTHYEDRIQIFDIRSQQKYGDVQTEVYFATPILR